MIRSEKMKKYCMLIVAFVMFISSIIFVNMYEVNANTIDATINRNIKGLIQKLEDDTLSNPQLSSSSNPYDYINNEYYDNIIKLGPKALPFLKEKVQISNQDGLIEHIMGIAAEEIAKVDLKSKYGWYSGKGWANKWSLHLKSVKKEISLIIDTEKNQEKKNEKLIKLGIPAIPYIIDEIEKGNVEIIPSLESLLSDNKEVTLTKDQVKDIKDWIKINRDSFKYIRTMVESE